jgi:hypothetical protein
MATKRKYAYESLRCLLNGGSSCFESYQPIGAKVSGGDCRNCLLAQIEEGVV